MNKKLIIYFSIFVLVILSIVFISSSVQAISRQERLGLKEKVRSNRNDRVECNTFCNNMQDTTINCNFCEQNEYCQIHQQNKECINRHHNECVPKTHNCRRNCDR